MFRTNVNKMRMFTQLRAVKLISATLKAEAIQIFFWSETRLCSAALMMPLHVFNAVAQNHRESGNKFHLSSEASKQKVKGTKLSHLSM